MCVCVCVCVYVRAHTRVCYTYDGVLNVDRTVSGLKTMTIKHNTGFGVDSPVEEIWSKTVK